MNSITVFEEKHMISTLLYLQSCEDHASRKIDLYRAVSSNPRMPDKLEALEAEGLLTIEVIRNEGPHAHARIQLTNRGQKVASLLGNIQEMMA